MNVQYDEAVRAWQEGFPLIEKATERLGQILGQYAGAAQVQWERKNDGPGWLTLRIEDFPGYVAGRLSLHDLESPAMTSFRLHRLFGDLLGNRTERHLEELDRLLGQP